MMGSKQETISAPQTTHPQNLCGFSPAFRFWCARTHDWGWQGVANCALVAVFISCCSHEAIVAVDLGVWYFWWLQRHPQGYSIRRIKQLFDVDLLVVIPYSSILPKTGFWPCNTTAWSPPPESDGPGQGATTTRDCHPLGKMLSGRGSPSTARQSQSRSPGEPDFRTMGWGSHAHSVRCLLRTSGQEPGVSVH